MKIINVVFLCLCLVACERCDKTPVPPPLLPPTGLYISPDGSDEAPCSYDEPCKTVLSTIKKMKGGETLYVRGGEYDEGEIWIRGDFATSPEKYLTIKAYNGEKPLFSNGVRHVIIEADYIAIFGLSFTNAKFIAQVNGHVGARIVGNTFTGADWGWAVISVEGSDIVISDNIISIDGNTVGSNGHGIYVHAGSNVEVNHNFISGTSGYGIHVFDQRRIEDPPEKVRKISNVGIIGNIVTGSRERAGIIVAAQSPDASAENISIAQNVVYDCAGDGIRIIDRVSAVKISNNTVYNINTDDLAWTGKDGIYLGVNVKEVEMQNNLLDLAEIDNADHVTTEGATFLTLSHGLYWPPPFRSNLTDPAAVIADPLFVDPKNGDFRLQAGSPAIDRGVDVGLPFTGSAPDIGAIER